ncbi:MAG: PAS domain S-box protein [Gammaproteobacteria bacterium]|nr:MAG: PAS domain S-box protein [Gammaproteobacteria bacterium]
MPRTAENTNWAATVDSIVSRAPRAASHRDPLRAQVRLLALLSSAAPLNALLGALASYVETWTEGLHCTVLLVDPTGRLLRPGAAPSLPEAYTHAIDPVPIGIGEGSCGTAAARREMVVVEDVEQSDLWTKYAPIALSYGLRACWSVPIVDDAGALLGTLALYYRERRAPSTHETDLIQFASSLAAFVMQRHRDAEKLRTTTLRESEARFRGAFEFAAIGIALVAPDGRWIRVNRALCGIVGYTAEELLATTSQAITHPDDLDADMEYMRQLLDGSRSHCDMEKRYFHKDGHIVWILLSVSLVRDDAGQPMYFVSQIQDITARKHAESQLVDSEFRYRTIANLVPGFVFEGVVRDGHPQPTWVSGGFERVYGCNLDRFIELGAKTFYDEATRARILAGASTIAQGSDLNIDVPLWGTDGVQRWLRVVARGVRTGPGAEVDRVLGVAEDITEQKRLEWAVGEATHQEQQRLGKEIHDGLGQELMEVALLARGLAASARKGHQPNADELDRLSLLASRTISTCHAIAQGLAPLSEAHGGLVQALHDMVDRQYDPSGPAVRFNAIEDAPIRLQWPSTDHLFRIAQEGLTNALKHAGAQSIRVTLDVQPDTVRLEISDDGVGLSPYAAESAGLGLKIMRYRAAMIDAHLSIGRGENGGTLLVCECRQPA